MFLKWTTHCRNDTRTSSDNWNNGYFHIIINYSLTCITFSFDCEEKWGKDSLNLSYYVKHSSGKLLSIKEKIYCKLIIYMLQWIIGFWVSHGQVLWQWICCCVIWNYYLKICLLKPQYFFEELPGPFIQKELLFFPSLHIFNSTKLCTDMGFYICNVCCVNGKVLVDESGFI